MKKKKAIVIAAISIAICIAAAMILLPKIHNDIPISSRDITPAVPQVTFHDNKKTKIETPSADEMFYIKDPALKLDTLPNTITQIGNEHIPGEFIGILGFSEYPLIFKNAWSEFFGVMSNSDGTAFLAEAYYDMEKVLYYGKDGVVKKISEPNIISAFLLSDGEEIAWISGHESSNSCTVKKLKNDEVTTLTKKAANFAFSGYYMTPFMGLRGGNSLIWYENLNEKDLSFETHLHKDGVTTKLGENMEVVSLAYDGERIFYEQNGKLFVQNGTDSANRVYITDYNAQVDTTGLNDWSVESLGTMGLNKWDVRNSDYISLSQPDINNFRVIPLNHDYSKVLINVSSLNGYKHYYYEESKTPILLFNEEISIKTPIGAAGIDDIGDYYFTTQNDDYSFNVYRYDGELKAALDYSVSYFYAFADTDNVLYETEENLWIHDSKTGEHTSVYEISDNIIYEFTPDLSLIYVRDSAGDYNGDTLYEVKPDGTKTRIAVRVQDHYLDGETLYYLTAECDLYVFENGKSEKVISFDESYDNSNWSPIEGHDSGYLRIAIYTKSEDEGTPDTYNYFLSTDGRNFVNIMEYVK
jgi:hypothetical protein